MGYDQDDNPEVGEDIEDGSVTDYNDYGQILAREREESYKEADENDQDDDQDNDQDDEPEYLPYG